MAIRPRIPMGIIIRRAMSIEEELKIMLLMDKVHKMVLTMNIMDLMSKGKKQKVS